MSETAEIQFRSIKANRVMNVNYWLMKIFMKLQMILLLPILATTAVVSQTYNCDLKEAYYSVIVSDENIAEVFFKTHAPHTEGSMVGTLVSQDGRIFTSKENQGFSYVFTTSSDEKTGTLEERSLSAMAVDSVQSFFCTK